MGCFINLSGFKGANMSKNRHGGKFNSTLTGYSHSDKFYLF
ncbi:hypothetical protein SAMN05444266_105171 [Chitinophaga jiangningensis]|uniref:Uncharacterized protein n=1 Tax=Chitinophaga jiangningensis TaxID=1419482 RepID=A0A1M7DWQ0_9BACT|nr:hypothetical protein SAMN05444266_105171 [Chitinophaga jiangningensis]